MEYAFMFNNMLDIQPCERLVIVAFYKACKNVFFFFFCITFYSFHSRVAYRINSAYERALWSEVKRVLDVDLVNLVFWHLILSLIWTLPNLLNSCRIFLLTMLFCIKSLLSTSEYLCNCSLIIYQRGTVRLYC